MFKFAKTLKKIFTPIPPLKSCNDSMAYADKEKAELIAGSFLKAHHISETQTCHSTNIQNSIRLVRSSQVDFPDSEKTSLNELKPHIFRLKIKKPSGYDKISNRLVKNLPDCALSILVDIFNACLALPP